MEVPKQLCNNDFRFILIRKRGKEAIEEGWQKETNYKFDDPKLINHINVGGNSGIIGGFGNLLFIDVDSLEVEEKCKLLPETFTIKTGSKIEYKKHLYFLCVDKFKMRFTKKKLGDLGDVRSEGQYVIAPNSVHPDGNKYTILKDIPIARVSKKFIESVFQDLIDPLTNTETTTEKKEYLIDTKKRQSPFVKNCGVPDYVLNNKLGSNTSKNWKLFPYIIDVLNARDVSKDLYKVLADKQNHELGAVKGWVKKAQEGKLAKTSCKKMRDYLDQYHPELVEEVCGSCPLYKKVKKEEKEKEIEDKKILEKEIEDKKPNLSEKEIKKIIKESHKKIVGVLKYYCDLKEEYYSLIACWIIGTYFHNEFTTYPYLYFNAMKGSGKTRILRLIAILSRNGVLSGSMSESVLFRTAGERTLCIDEFEKMSMKEKQTIRELLNSAYKKGLVVERMKKSLDGEYEVERFDVYCPVVIANIWGMENVLADRCLGLILQKSRKKEIISLIENFDENTEIKDIVCNLMRGFHTTHTYTLKKQYPKEIWNRYLKSNNVSVSSGYSVSSVSSVSSVNLFNKIIKLNINGRDLELFFPIFIIADLCGKEVLDSIIDVSKIIVSDRKEADRDESRDVQLIEFISTYQNFDFVSITTLTNEFKNAIGSEEKWINTSWLGRALRRLVLVKDNRRIGSQRAVRIDIEKAKKDIKAFIEEKSEEKQDKIEVVKIK